MNINDFEVGNLIYSNSYPRIIFEKLSGMLKSDKIHIYSDLYPFLKEDWNLAEKKYTPKNAFLMLANNKVMEPFTGTGYPYKWIFKFNSNGNLIMCDLNNTPCVKWVDASLTVFTVKSTWIEYKGVLPE